MAKRRDPNRKEYNPLDDARGRLPIEPDLVREVISETAAPAGNAEPQISLPPAMPPPVAAPPILPVEPPAPIAARREARVQPAKTIVVEKLTAYNKFLTTPTEKLELDRLAARVSGALGVSVKSSQLIRACLVLMLRAEQEVIRRAERQPAVKRPSNTEVVALAEFDHLLAEVLSQGFRDAGPLKPRQ
jgi:hypothetical protein